MYGRRVGGGGEGGVICVCVAGGVHEGVWRGLASTLQPIAQRAAQHFLFNAVSSRAHEVLRVSINDGDTPGSIHWCAATPAKSCARKLLPLGNSGGGGSVGLTVGEQSKVLGSYRHLLVLRQASASAFASAQTISRHRWPCQPYVQPGSDQQSYQPAIRQHTLPPSPGVFMMIVVTVTVVVACSNSTGTSADSIAALVVAAVSPPLSFNPPDSTGTAASSPVGLPPGSMPASPTSSAGPPCQRPQDAKGKKNTRNSKMKRCMSSGWT